MNSLEFGEEQWDHNAAEGLSFEYNQEMGDWFIEQLDILSPTPKPRHTLAYNSVLKPATRQLYREE